MEKSQKKVFVILILISMAYFVLAYFPNAVASDDQAMVWVFNADEGSPLSFVLRMIEPQPDLKESVYRFFMYEYYFYGFPYFAFSALFLLPLRLASQLSNIPLVMVMLRQFVSVLPMVSSILMLVYLQTRFKSLLKSISLFILLLFVPAVMANNFWWHPDGLAMLFVVLTIFFLDRDDQKFGRNFYWAAFSTGLATGTKILGVYFFLTIPVYLLIGYFSKRINFKKGLTLAFAFVGIMALTYLVVNPTLIYADVRAKYLETFAWQSGVVAQGYEVQYARGPASWGVLFEYFGASWYLLLSLGVLIYGVFRAKNRMLYIIILTWAVPFGIYTLFFTALKFQYLIPILLPVFSSLSLILPPFPSKWFVRKDPIRRRAIKFVLGLAIVLISIQFVVYLGWDVGYYEQKLHRADNKPTLAYFENFKNEYLLMIPGDRELYIYHDPQIYVAESDRWYTDLSFEMLDYKYFNEPTPHFIILQQQRIWDYTNEFAVENYLDPAQGERSYLFYTDADAGNLAGFRLVYRDEAVLAFVREDVYLEYFAGEN